MRTVFWWENPKDRDHLENLGVDRRIILKCILTLRLLMSYIYIYIYGAHIFDVFRSHTTTHHSR